MFKLKHIIWIFILSFLSPTNYLPCSAQSCSKCGNYISQGDFIIERKNVDGWREGHYLLTIDTSDIFVLKEVSVKVGVILRVCSGNLQGHGQNSYFLYKVKKDYPYGALGNPRHIDDEYHITIKNNDTIILQNGQWETIMKRIPQDSIPKDFDFTQYGYDN